MVVRDIARRLPKAFQKPSESLREAFPKGITTLDIALGYAAQGLAVVPLWGPHGRRCSCRAGLNCDRPGKHPRTRHGVSGATTDTKRIRAWKWETANIGIATGERSGLVVLDVDPRNHGHVELCKLIGRLGKLPEGPTAFTGGRGVHLLFRYPGIALRGKAAPGVDVKADGGYVVAPPSVHSSGRTYDWLRGPGDEFPELPASWLDFLSKSLSEGSRTTQGTHGTQGTQELSVSPPSPVLGFFPINDLEKIARSCVPSGPGHRNDSLVTLARKLKAIPECAVMPAADLLPVFEAWYASSLPYLGTTDRLTNWGKFVELWAWCKVPWGSQAIGSVVDRARSGSGPAIADRLGIDNDQQRLLMRICRELQRDWGANPFFLSARTAGNIVGVHFTTAATWLNAFQGFRVLSRVKLGDRINASEWRYLPPLNE